MGKINSWRNEPLQSKNLGYYKRINSGRMGPQNGRNEDMNEIIKRKCQFILDR